MYSPIYAFNNTCDELNETNPFETYNGHECHLEVPMSPSASESDAYNLDVPLYAPSSPVEATCPEEDAAMPQESTIPIYIPEGIPKFGIPIPTLQNIVGTCYLGMMLDLKGIALRARNTEYNPKRFSAVVMRIREPQTTALIFCSGKMVVTGAKSEESCRLAGRKFARAIQKIGYPVSFNDFQIRNLVCSVNCGFPLHLEAIDVVHRPFTQYEPEIFPALVYRMVSPKVTFMIFHTGKVNITGAKTREDIDEGFEAIYPVLKAFKK